MSILLIGNLSDAEYTSWRYHLSRHLPNNQPLVLGNETYDARAIEVALTANPPPGSLCGLPNLRFIQSVWAGVDRLLTDASLPPDVPIARLIDPSMTQAMVECAIGHVLYLHRQMPTYLQQQSQRTWRQLPQPLASDRPVGILGLGALGYAVAKALAQLRFPVAGWSLHARQDATLPTHQGAEGLATVARGSQILINLLPLTPQTAGLLNLTLFQQLPPGAAVINLARGGHLVERDLLTALDSRQLSHAVLDTFALEPLPTDHPFWGHPQITALPHVAAGTDPASAARIVGENISAFCAGRQVSGLVSRTLGY